MTEEVAHEHQVVQAALDSAVAACASWRQHPAVETGAALAASLDHLNEALQRPWTKYASTLRTGT
jgi:hypothetical protein